MHARPIFASVNHSRGQTLTTVKLLPPCRGGDAAPRATRARARARTHAASIPDATSPAPEVASGLVARPSSLGLLVCVRARVRACVYGCACVLARSEVWCSVRRSYPSTTLSPSLLLCACVHLRIVVWFSVV